MSECPYPPGQGPFDDVVDDDCDDGDWALAELDSEDDE